MKKQISVDEYINSFPENVKKRMLELRKIIKTTIPEAKEVFSYGIPTYDINGHVVHFGGYKTHIGFYPTSSGIDNFKEELKHYKCSKGTIKFPLDESLPEELIIKIIIFRKGEDSKKSS